MSRIALVTSSDYPDLTADDRLLVAPLRALGIETVPAVWTDHSVDWAAFDGVVVRSPWDWVPRAAEFIRWLASVDHPSVRMANSAALMRSHLDKTYLLPLAEKGVSIVETSWVAPRETLDLAAWLERRGETRGVLKPSLSGGADRTIRFDRATTAEAEAHLAAITATGTAMVQPYAREIAAHGEISFVFFDGEIHHALRKRPAQGDFRVQTEHGGTAVSESPSPSLMAQATAAVKALPEDTLYARVDGIDRDGTLVVMELEVVEPELFLRLHPQAPHAFAGAIARRFAT